MTEREQERRSVARPVWRRALRWAGLALGLALAVAFGRWLARPGVPPATAAMRAQAARVEVVRDRYGVAHVFGETDADAAFGLAYAHAEDDWPVMEQVLIASRGQLSRTELSARAFANDYYCALFDIAARVEEAYERDLSEDTRRMLEGYAAGLNFYASEHPEEADGRFLPLSARDIVAGFVHKIPLMLHLGDRLEKLRERPYAIGERLHPGVLAPSEMTGSNSHAVAAARSTDGVTRLNINSHQPWDGPVAWHEVHITSKQGWNVSGANFPGAPMVLVGHNDHLGWAHTFNYPDLIDVYRLTVDEGGERYRLDGAWRDLERREARLRIELGVFELSWPLKIAHSAHGPVFETDHGSYALRVAGIERIGGTAEQWFRMNKARDVGEWKDAMALQALPLFNTLYASRDHVGYVYNAAIPRRTGDVDYGSVLPGDSSALIWQGYVPFKELPAVEDPPSGFVQNCNSPPWLTTEGAGNPPRSELPAHAGVSSRVNNRALRSRATFGADPSISREEFLTYKWDQRYEPEAPMFVEGLRPLFESFEPADETERAAIALLESWDGDASVDNRAAALAILFYRPLWSSVIMAQVDRYPDRSECLRAAIAILMEHHGRLDPELGEVQRLRRGHHDLPLGGGPDVLNAIHGRLEQGRLIGVGGDSFVMLVEFGAEGVRSSAIHQYGNVNRPASPHFDDQAKLFAARRLRPVLRTRAELVGPDVRAYHPGLGR